VSASKRAISVGGALALTLGVVLVAGAITTAARSPLAQQPSTTPGATAAASPAATPTPLSLQTLSQLQPGLSTYMMEAAQRFGVMWFAAQQNNWDLAAFEGRETEGVLQKGAVRSNQSRQQGITAFNTNFLEPLIQAAQSGDKAKFEAAYNSAIQGCNSCHGAQTYGAINKPFSFIKVQVPKNSPEDVYAYIP
jgi:mono/diheme cytochrome c family protein